MKTSEITLTVPEYTIGTDLGDRKHAVCVMGADGTLLLEKTITNEREHIRNFAKKYPHARVAMEVGTHSPWVSRVFEELGHEVLVANARKLRVIYENHRKSDKVDARMLARLARVDPSLLHPIQHQSEEAQRDLLQIKLRDTLARQRVDMISSVRFTLKSLGIRIKSPNTNYFAKRARTDLSENYPDILATIEPVLQVIDGTTEQIKALFKKIEIMAREKYPAAKRLQEIRGVGPITALTYVLTICDPARFDKSRDVGPYLGLVPKRDQSGSVDKQMRISKAGDAYLRRLLVGASQYILGPFGEECDLRRHGLALADRGGQGAKKKAVVAIARKLAVLMHALWIKDIPYEPNRREAKAA